MKKSFFKTAVVLVIILVGFGALSYFSLKFYIFLNEFRQVKGALTVYQRVNEVYESIVERKNEENLALREQLINQEAQIDNVSSTLEDLKQNVNTIVKLRSLDEELLKKYSKVYFLNENYVPKTLLPIDSQYVNNSKEQYIHGNVLPFLYTLLEEAKKNQIDLKVKWGYRSFFEQANIKSSSSFSYGSGANKFVADQGYSEHQLGTTIDFTTSEFNGNSSLFHKTKAYKWLLENAYKYGFILSYPENNKYYIFEPWHWRFVGIRLATKLHQENKNFYDLDQREIDEYLISIFDW